MILNIKYKLKLISIDSDWNWLIGTRATQTEMDWKSKRTTFSKCLFDTNNGFADYSWRRRRLSHNRCLCSRCEGIVYVSGFNFFRIYHKVFTFNISKWKAGGSQKKTVLFYIHGGGFTEGSARGYLQGPDFLLSADNILVFPQYRVGIFGFLNLDTPEYSGNMGLKDQQMALKWTYENIENFYGNKDEILIFGNSAGKF